MIQNKRLKTMVVVVDPDRADYEALAPLAERDDVKVRFFPKGRDAMRAARRRRRDFWLIGTQLPDMSGFDLYEMIRDRLDGASVCLVGSEYRVEDEVRAYRAGATLYTCKPVEASWLRECLRQTSNLVDS